MKQARVHTARAGLAVAAALLAGAVGAGVADAAEQFLPLPAQALPLPQTASGYRLQKIGPTGYLVTAGIYQAVFVVTRAGVVLIDAPPAMTEALKAAIRSVTDQRVAYIILSHDHDDHIGGTPKFPGAKLVAHIETARLLSIYPDPQRPVPKIVFAGERYTLTVGGETFRLIYPGPSHEAGDIIVYVPGDKLAIMTDLIVPGWAPYLGWGVADYIPGYFKAFAALLQLDFDTYVGGHLYRAGTRQDVEDARAYMADLWTWTKAEMAATPPHPVGEAANVWATQMAWFDQVADRVTARLVTKWGDRLAGVDAFSHDTVISAMISITTDNPNIPPDLMK